MVYAMKEYKETLYGLVRIYGPYGQRIQEEKKEQEWQELKKVLKL